MSETVLSFSVDKQIEQQAKAKLAAVGLTIAEAVVAFLREVADNHIPADILTYPPIIPHAETIAAMQEPDETRVSFSSIDALMADLNADD